MRARKAAVYSIVILLSLLVLTACIHVPVNPGIQQSSADLSLSADVACLTSDASLLIDTQATAATQPAGVWSQGLSHDNISLLSWNIYKESRDDWQADFRRLSQGRDLLLLQEARMNAGLQAELGAPGYRWAMTQAFYRDDVVNGVLTASKQAAVSHCSQYVSEPVIVIPKSLLVSRYPLKGTVQTLLVANVHGINFTLGLGSYREQFTALADVLERHDGPIVLAGDFNSWSDGRLAVLNDFAQRIGLQQVGYQSNNRTRIFQHSIDHVYYRGLDVVDFSVPRVESSDHNPLLVTFKLDVSYESLAQN